MKRRQSGLVYLINIFLVSNSLILGSNLVWSQESTPFETAPQDVESDSNPKTDMDLDMEPMASDDLSQEGDTLDVSQDTEQGVVAGENPKEIRYTVLEGDTLWDITQSIWEDPFLWPKVWRNNLFIQNPDLIFPGNVLIFPVDLPEMIEEVKPPAAPPVPVREEKVEQPPPTPEPPVVAVAPPPPPPAEPPAKPKKPKLDHWLLASSGFIVYDLDPSGRVVRTEEGRRIVGENDFLFILPEKGTPLDSGDQVLVYRNMRKVYHPKTKKFVGELIRVLGIARVVDTTEAVRKAKVENSFHYITKEDLILPYDFFFSHVVTTDVAMTQDEGLPQDMQGYIVEVKEGYLSNAQFEIVYLDKGQRDGIKRGHTFDVIREGERISTRERLPRRIIGQLEVLSVQDSTSTAKIVQSSDVIFKGDLVEPSPKPQAP